LIDVYDEVAGYNVDGLYSGVDGQPKCIEVGFGCWYWSRYRK